ncbi:hypothetical protein WJX81_005589 [Elliptochloris bilobata]|uniref:Dolichol phosphate-mannose biosynthesis regulatory protein n=1 Tax=Elliptochloris bilobata TaxID=381761 RepID=A0AAW1SIA6_9CHLO
MFEDRLLGKLVLVFGSIAFLYYSVWILVTPFLAEDSALLAVFPPGWWAQLLPAVVAVLVTTGVLGYIGWILVASQLCREAPGIAAKPKEQ